MEVLFIPVKTINEIQSLADLASMIWNEYFVQIISKEQIDYMLDKFQSMPTLTKQIGEDGYEYFFIEVEGEKAGYIGIHQEEDAVFLSKLYILKEFRGNGYATNAFSFLRKLCKKRNLNKIWLTVNRYNEHTVEVYKAKGFVVVREQKADIGNGFFMDDFVMELLIK